MRHRTPGPRVSTGLSLFALAALVGAIIECPCECAAEAKGTVKGLVVAEDGKPIAGARVRAVRVSFCEVLDPFEPDLDVSTDAQGRFEAAVRAGEYIAIATKGLLTSDAAPLPLPPWDVASSKTLEVRIPLRKGGRIEGTVAREGDGRPVSSAKVALLNGLTATANEEGRFTIEGVAFGEHWLQLAATGLASRSVPFNTSGQEVARVRIEMAPGFTVRGRVTDPAGRPVRGALVQRPTEVGWRLRDDPLVGRERRVALRSMNSRPTDAEGRYELPGLSYGRDRVHLGVRHPQFAQSYGSVSPPGEGSTATLDLQLKEGFAIEGEVLDPDGKPVRGAEVIRRLADRDDSARTDDKGFFRLGRLRAGGRDCVVVVAGGYAPAAQNAKPGKGKLVPKLSFRLTRGKTIEGRVADREGRGVAGAVLLPMASIPPDT